MADVGIIIGCNAADKQVDFAFFQRLERLYCSGEGGVEAEHCRTEVVVWFIKVFTDTETVKFK